MNMNMNMSMSMEESGLTMATHLLQQTLRGFCIGTDWVYAVFWRILPRSYPPPKWDSENMLYDRSKGNKRNWILAWEDGFCDFVVCARYASENTTNSSGEKRNLGLQPDLFFKMSHEVYNFGEGLMGKVAADNSHKWIFRDPCESETNFFSPWRNTIDPHPRTWEGQFNNGIQTIALISVREGLVQLGSTKKVVEDLNFVISLQRKFNILQGIPGVFLPHPSLYMAAESQSNAGRHLERSLSWSPPNLQGQNPNFHHLHNAPLLHPHELDMRNMMRLSQQQMQISQVTPSMSSLQALLSKLPAVTQTQASPPINPNPNQVPINPNPNPNQVPLNPMQASCSNPQALFSRERSLSFPSQHIPSRREALNHNVAEMGPNATTTSNGELLHYTHDHHVEHNHRGGDGNGGYVGGDPQRDSSFNHSNS